MTRKEKAYQNVSDNPIGLASITLNILYYIYNPATVFTLQYNKKTGRTDKFSV